MPFQDPQDYARLVSSYLNGDFLLNPLPEGFSNFSLDSKLILIYKIFIKHLPLCDLTKKLAMIRSIDEVLLQLKSKKNIDINRRIADFKNVFCVNGETDNWKNALLSIKSKCLQKYCFPEIQLDINAANSLMLNDQQFKQKLSGNSYTVIGSSFKTNKLSILGELKAQPLKPKVAHCLDALYISENHDSQSKVCGYTLALGDGAGGHFGDPEQDKQIARAAYFASKHAVRLLNSLPNAEAFDATYKNIISAIAEEIKFKVRNGYREGTTLVAVRAFYKEGKYHLKGFSIGDSMVVAYQPKQQKLTTIAPAKVLVSEFNGQEGTAIIPSSYKDYEVDILSEVVEPGTIVMAFSDGVYDHLPCTASSKTYPNGATCRVTSLNNGHFTSLFANALSNNTLENCVKIVTQQMVNTVDKMREQQIQQVTTALSTKSQVESQFLLEEKLLRQEQEKINNHYLQVDADSTMSELDKQNIKQQLQSQQASLKQQILMARAPLEKLLNELDIQLGDDVAIVAVCLPEIVANPITANKLAEKSYTTIHQNFKV